MNISITGRNLELTNDIKEYTHEKIGGLTKFFDGITQARVELGKESHQQKGDVYYAHVTLSVPGKTLRVEESEPRIQKAIDKAKDDLQSELKKYKGKLNKKAEKLVKTMEVSQSKLSSEADYQFGSTMMD